MMSKCCILKGFIFILLLLSDFLIIWWQKNDWTSEIWSAHVLIMLFPSSIHGQTIPLTSMFNYPGKNGSVLAYGWSRLFLFFFFVFVSKWLGNFAAYFNAQIAKKWEKLHFIICFFFLVHKEIYRPNNLFNQQFPRSHQSSKGGPFIECSKEVILVRRY